MEVLSNFLAFLTFLTVVSAVRDALPEEFPFQVSIKGADKRHLCGGAIITSKWVLTSSDCMGLFSTVFVGYGNSDSSYPVETIQSKRIVHQRDSVRQKKEKLALIELSKDIIFSNTARPAKLPTEKAQLRNTTKLSGWDLNTQADIPPNLSVTDQYFVITEDCRTSSGMPVQLGPDEFCGVDEKNENILTNPGSIVSKSSIVLGVLAQRPISYLSPVIFIKMSQNEQWVREVLGDDAQKVTWVDKVPKNSAQTTYTTTFLLLGISTAFARYL